MSIPLISAAYCCNCDRIVDKLDRCPACGSSALLCLARVLNRKVAA
jgi:rRNA maturation endonuclease Nob1